MSSDYKVCPTCGTEYPANERFCPRDGTALRSPSQGTDLVGSVVADRYDVLRKLGEGGMGQVYLAEHVKMKRKSALKVMHPGMVHDADAIARFNREAANASRINHPHVAAIYDFGETPDGLIYLAMEFIEGQPLTKLIEQQGALAPARAAEITCQTGDALQIAHDMGIVHRDLKPDNIMIARNRDGSDCVKVVDFGIAKAAGSEAQKVTKTGLVVGTPEYMSPEQLAGDKLDGRSDIYSLGLVAFNMLTGKLPFPSETVQEAMIMRLTDRPRTLAEMKPEVAWPPVVEQVIAKALARDAKDRYQSAAEFGRDMVRAVEQMPRSAAFGAPPGATAVVGGVTAMLPKTNVNAPARPSAGTQVLGASAPAAAPGAGEAATRAVPAGAGAAAVAAVAVPIEPKRGGGRMPLIAGGLAAAALLAAVGVYALVGGKPAGTDVTAGTANPTGTQLASAASTGPNATSPEKTAAPPNVPSGSPAGGGSTAGNGSATTGGAQTRTASRPSAEPPAGAGGGTSGSATRPGTPLGGAPVPSGMSRTEPLSAAQVAALAALHRIGTLMSDPSATASVGRKALGELGALDTARLSHDGKMEALFYKAQALGLIDDQPTRACKVLAEILEQPTSSFTAPAREARRQLCE